LPGSDSYLQKEIRASRCSEIINLLQLDRFEEDLNISKGGFVIFLKHEDVAQALIWFVKEYGITHVALGHLAKKSLRLFGRLLHDELMRELAGDLVII
jgi:K+-sensing histidine kinase KdpD